VKYLYGVSDAELPEGQLLPPTEARLRREWEADFEPQLLSLGWVRPGFGRTVVSEIEAPNLSVNLV
jgi:hypothetical protein